MNQPDFSDTFVEWLRTVRDFPKAFDLKYESIASVLDLNVPILFGMTAETEKRVLCTPETVNKCEFGFTFEDFEESWRNKLKSLKLAITIYLKEPSGLTSSKFFIPKGSSECRFTILNYISPYWIELANEDAKQQEFHLTMTLDKDEPAAEHSESYFEKNDEIYFTKKEEFWLAKRKGFNFLISNRIE